MAAIHLLRSQFSLLYSSKFQLARPSINSLIIPNQNPNLSRHFHPIHSITPKSSPKGPTSGGCRTFSNAQSKPTNSIKSVASNGEEDSRNLVNVTKGVSTPAVSSAPIHTKYRCTRCKVFGHVRKNCPNRINISRNSLRRGEEGKSVGSNWEEESMIWINLSSNVAESAVSRNFERRGEKGNSVGSNGEVGAGNRVNLSSNVAESAAPRNFEGKIKKKGYNREKESNVAEYVGRGEEGNSVGSNRDEELGNRIYLSSNVAESVVPRNFVRGGEKGNSLGSNREEELGNRVNLSLNVAESVVLRNIVRGGEKGNSVDSNREEESGNQVNLSSNVAESVVPMNFVRGGEKGNSVGSNREEESGNRVNLSSNVAESVVPMNFVRAGEKGNSVGSNREEESGNRVNLSSDVAESVVSRNIVRGGEKGNSLDSNREEESGNRVNLSSNVVESVVPNVAESVVPRNFVQGGGKGDSVGSNGGARNWVNVSSNVAESIVPWNFVRGGKKGNSVGSNREEESGNRVNLSSNVVKSVVPRDFVRGGETGNSVGSNREEESGNRVNLSSNVADSVVPRDFGRRGEKGNTVVCNGEEESGNLVNLSSNVAESVVPRNFVGRWEKGNVEEDPRNRVYFDLRNFVWGGEKGNSKMYPVCSDCGHSTTQWRGICKLCNEIGTLKQFSVSENQASGNMMKLSWLPEQMVGQNIPVRLMDVNRGINHMEGRIRLAGLLGLEVNRVLGGGVVPGSLILIGGDPGVGKSTLALQMAALIAVSFDVGAAAPVLYISSEESVEQIGNRADRLSVNTEDLFLYSSTAIEDILEKVQLLSPCAVVVDSIQSVYLKGMTGSPGGLMQVKECTSALLRFAKQTNIPVLLIGHVNKNGEVAGPRDLERIVDVVLYMEGERHPSHRLLHSIKNRFGSSDELGVFEMSESGLEAVSNPSEMFLSEEHSDSVHLVGLAIAVIIDGSRSLLVKVQASCVSGPVVSRHVNGVQQSRADIILSVLQNQVGLKLGDHSIILNVISGVSLTDTSGDLAVAAAVCSSFLEFPLPNNVAFIGEIGLGGELLMVPRIEKRVITLAKLGYKKCVVPESAGKALVAISSEIQIVGCKNLKQVIDKVFSTCKF